jgi:hypothetical protein
VNRRTALAVAAPLAAAMLAGGAVAVATRDRPVTTSLTPAGDHGGDAFPTALPTVDLPTGSPTATPSRFVLTSPEPPYRQGLPATPDPPRSAGQPLPTGCLSYFHDCAYPGATGAVTGGPEWADCPITGTGRVRLSWRTRNTTPQRSWATPTEFVVRAYLMHDNEDPLRDPARLTQARLPITTSAYTFAGLQQGGQYLFGVWELNSSGIGGIACGPVRLPAPPPTQSPTPSPAPTATPTPTPTASPTPTATVSP